MLYPALPWLKSPFHEIDSVVASAHEKQRGNIICDQPNQGMTAKERTRRLNAAFDAMADGMSQDELAEMTAAMTGVRAINGVREQDALKTNAAERRGNQELINRCFCADGSGDS